MSIDPTIYKIYEACERTGWKGDPVTLANALKKLNYGLPVQDEFCLLMSWLGRCKLIHGLEQSQYPPASKTDYQVPDFYAVFDTGAGRLPVLIEVKSKTKLSWKPEYYESLQRYGEEMGLPVLVAWKETRTRFWTLVDISRFSKARQNYNLSFSDAIQNSLMSMLAGDFMIEFTPGFGMHLHFRKLSPQGQDGVVSCVVEEAYFQGAEGERFTTLKGGLWPFFMTLDVPSEIEETDTHIHQSFVVMEKCGSQLAHRGFPALFMTRKGKRWRNLLEKHQFAVGPQDMWEAAREAAEYSATKGLMRIIPQNIPPYLEKARGLTAFP